MNNLNVLNDLKLAKEIITQHYSKNLKGYSSFSPLFSFSNENISSYYKMFDFKNKEVLTVCGSSEQVLSAVALGAKKVDTFDINRLTYYYLSLKVAAIISLDENTFIDFFDMNNSYTKRLDIYKKVRDFIDDSNIKLFWDNILKIDDNINYLLIDDSRNLDRFRKSFPYLDEENYSYLKKVLPTLKINFENISIEKLNTTFKNKYDYINLSNIIDYMDSPEKIKKTYSYIFKNMLKKRGICVFEYEWPLIHLCDFDLSNIFKNYNIDVEKLENDNTYLGKIYTYKN